MKIRIGTIEMYEDAPIRLIERLKKPYEIEYKERFSNFTITKVDKRNVNTMEHDKRKYVHDTLHEGDLSAPSMESLH